MKILKVEAGKAPYEKEIENKLSAIQEEVGGGPFQPLYLGKNIILCCNEEGKINGMELNRRLGSDIICGPFFLVGDDGHGDFSSLTAEQIKLCQTAFGEVQQFSGDEPELQARMEFYVC